MFIETDHLYNMNKEYIPWVEKYRPRTLKDVCGNNEIINVLDSYGGISRIPHLLLYGPPGSGKTSTILSMARDHYGIRDMSSMVLELNASDDRDIETVRTTIKNFTSNSSLLGVGNGVKLVILDEADALTMDAQAALRRIIEKSTKNVRFCICCNYVNKITPAIQSRCCKFRFKGLDNTSLGTLTRRIIEEEKILIESDAVDAIISLAKGDTRRVINLLQCVGLGNIHGKIITNDDIYICAGAPFPKDIDSIIETVKCKTFQESFMYVRDIMKNNGYSLVDIIHGITDRIIYDQTITDERMGILLEEFSNIEYNLSEGGSENIQLSALVGSFHLNN